MSEVVSRFRFFVFSIATLAALGVPARIPARAQTHWTIVRTFPSAIGCGYFFDENHGVIGSGVRWAGTVPNRPAQIYKTTDGGTTWTATTVPTLINAAVTSIWFQDSLTGYASLLPSVSYDADFTFGGTSLWKSTDGGSTWFDPYHLDHAITSAYGQNGLIVITKWDMVEYSQGYPAPPDLAGGNYSTDGGATWTPAFRRANGIAFSDSLHGVVTEMNPDAGGNTFWFTSDAGRTWNQTLTNQYESWSVYAMRGTGIFLCANESQPGLPSNVINWSTDYGATWRTRGTVATPQLTGTIAGVGGTLYLQKDSGWYMGDPPRTYNDGLWRSDDTGAQWHLVGAPMNSRDTRFVVTGCMGQTVYAFDGLGNVYKTSDGGDGSLHGSFQFTSDTINWEPNVCGDTLTFPVFGSNCIPITIDSILVPESSEFLSILDSGRADSGTLPQTLAESDSASITILYSPTKGGRAVSEITMFAHSGENYVTKVLTIITQNDLTNGLALSKDTASMFANLCVTGVDTVLLTDLACPGMILDSIVLPPGETSVSNLLPENVPPSGGYPIGFLFNPDSSGTHSLTAKVYAHIARRPFDTTIAIFDTAMEQPARFTIDSNSLSLATKYCQPVSAFLPLLTNACDSLIVDSVVSSNGNFSLVNIPVSLLSNVVDSVGILFDPDSDGVDTGTVRIFAHDRAGACDTVISITAANVALPQCETLSDTTLTMATTGCQSLADTLMLGNLGCDTLFLDSALVDDDSEIAILYDSTLLPLAGGDSLPIRVIFNPENGNSKSLTMRLVGHTSQRTIDTAIALAVSNAVPTEPLTLSTDSLDLFTKYCQPVSLPLVLQNFGCAPMTLDSILISGDARNEFSLGALPDTIANGGGNGSCSFQFVPDSSGTRALIAKLYLHENGKAIDTTLAIAAENLTAPVPFLPPLPSLTAGTTLEIPIMIEPTSDTFTIQSYAFYLAFNTDLLTPVGLAFTGTCDENILSSTYTVEPGGVSGRVWVTDTISDTSNLALPLVFVSARVSLALDTTTPVTLDSFVTDREPTLAPCSIPESEFTLAPACGDPLLLEEMRSESLSFRFISLAPNPAQSGNWDLDYLARTATTISLDLYDASGSHLSHYENLPGTIGEHHASIPIPATSGDYFLLLGNGSETVARKGSVAR